MIGDDGRGADAPTEADLFAAYAATKDREVRNRLVEQHRGLAVHLARRFDRRGEPLDDLIQVAMVGIVHAVERFDPERGIAFSSFATPTVLGELRRHFRDHTWAVRVPRPVKDLHLRARAATDELRERLGRAPTLEELAAETDSDVEHLLEALDAEHAYRPTSLSAPDPSGRGPSTELAAAGDDFARSDLTSTIRQLIDRLPERERMIITLRFYDELTQEEIAARVGCSQMHVSRLLRATLERLGRQGNLVD